MKTSTNPDSHKQTPATITFTNGPLHDLIKPAALIPCPLECKGPVGVSGWQTFTIGALDDAEFVAELDRSNIAVNLGAPSAGLCSIDIDEDAHVAPFLAANPKLRGSLRTRRVRGCNIWLRISGEYPAAVIKLRTTDGDEIGEWRADGGCTMIYGSAIGKGESVPTEYRVSVEARPVEIKFAEIVWPAGIIPPRKTVEPTTVAKELEAEYGESFYLDKKGESVTGLNERHWAGLYDRTNTALFDVGSNSFYLYDPTDGLWKPETAAAISETIAKKMLKASRETKFSGFERHIPRFSKNAAERLEGIIEKRGAFDEKPRIIHVGNGVIDFSNSELQFKEFSPDYFSRNQCPIDFDPDAGRPNRFLDELILPAMNADNASLLQRWLGIAIYGYNLPQRFLMLTGQAGGGKGTLALIVQGLVGRHNLFQLRTSHLADKFEIGRAFGRTLFYGPDVPGNFMEQKGAERIKSIVGGDPLTGEVKGSMDDLEMHGTFNMLVTCNTRLRVRIDGDTGAWRRRMLEISYDNPPVKKPIPNFDQQLIREEGSEILGWAVEGFIQAIEDFEKYGNDYVLTDAQQSRIDSLLAESQSLEQFVSERLAKTAGCDVTTEEIKSAYGSFCAEKGWTPVTTVNFDRSLPDLMLCEFQITKSNDIKRGEKSTQRGYRNIEILE